MTVTKGNVVYQITELKDKWKVTSEKSRVEISIEVPKGLCRNEEELKEYILKNELF